MGQYYEGILEAYSVFPGSSLLSRFNFRNKRFIFAKMLSTTTPGTTHSMNAYMLCVLVIIFLKLIFQSKRDGGNFMGSTIIYSNLAKKITKIWILAFRIIQVKAIIRK